MEHSSANLLFYERSGNSLADTMGGLLSRSNIEDSIYIQFGKFYVVVYKHCQNHPVVFLPILGAQRLASMTCWHRCNGALVIRRIP